MTTDASQGAECNCLVVKLSAEVSDMSEAMRVALLRGTDLIIERLAACLIEGEADGSLDTQADAHHTAVTLYELWLGAALLSKLRRDHSALNFAMSATLQLLNLKEQPAL